MRKFDAKRWKAVLAAFLAVVLVLQSSNLQAIAQEVMDQVDQPGNEQVIPNETLDDVTDDATDDVTDDSADDVTDESANQDPKEDATSTTEPTEEGDVTKTDPAPESSTTTPADPEGNTDPAPSEEPAADVDPDPADETATVEVKISGATLTYKVDDAEKNVTADTEDKTLEVPATLDFKFTLKADDGQEVSRVQLVDADGVATYLNADDNDEYTIAADDLADATIKVETEEAPADTAEESTPETTPSDNAEKDDAVEAEETTPSAAPGVQSAGDEIESLSISGQKQVAIGETIRLSSDSPASSEGWMHQTYTHK